MKKISELLHIPVRINQQREILDRDTELILQKINRFTLDPFRSLDQLYLFSGICSNNRLDSYMTKMHETSLTNYANDLRNGVPLLPNHDITQSPLGRSYDGTFENEEVDSYWYMVRDLNINGENTNDTIRAIQAGIKKDLSIGFGGDLWYRCSSCNRDMWDYECPHFPGLEDENGIRVFVWVMDATLREVSLVYKGATPGAFVNKAREFHNQGDLDSKRIVMLENAYNIRLDDGKRSFYLPNKNEQKEDEQMGNQARNSLLDDIRTAIRENKIEKAVIYDMLAEEGDPFRQPEDIAIRNELGKDYSSVQAIRQLKKEAQTGRRYVADVIDMAVAARVKAQGDSFNADSYRSMLSMSGDIDHIKDEIDSYERLAKQRFVGGRQTEPEDLEPKDDDRDDSEENAQRLDPDSDNIFSKEGAE
ncbi:hypothetical protein ACSU6B_23240 [Neobacillus sp. C211]|uniref:hypothetical protein n=1 Tax=unclassified Neobacillus TaxID=2675272 RepID=UPI00397B84F8